MLLRQNSKQAWTFSKSGVRFVRITKASASSDVLIETESVHDMLDSDAVVVTEVDGAVN